MTLLKIDDCPDKVRKFVSIACENAENSVMKDRIGSVVTIGGKAVSSGYNNNERTVFDGESYCSCHSEMDALWQLKGQQYVLQA